jgi:soluble lytic murein transglycosylase-like protein
MTSRRFIRSLFLAAATLASAQPAMARQVSARTPVKAAVAKKPVRPVLSAYEQEQALSPSQLLKRWDPLVAKAARRFKVPETWISAVMRLESGGRTMLTESMRMVSDKGAMGLMQVLPGTYQEMAAQYRLGRDPFDTGDNITAGTAYLRWLNGKYGYPNLFAAYNAGPQRVDDFLAKGTPLPAETQHYVSAIGTILDDRAGTASLRFATLTRPDGTPVLIDPLAVRSIREVFPGEYADGVQSVVNMGALKQGVREDMAAATTAIRRYGGKI